VSGEGNAENFMKRIFATAVVFGASVWLAVNGTVRAANATNAGIYVDDSVITAKIKSALVADRGVNGFDIHVETRQGQVSLSGSVDSQAQAERAAAIAGQVDGVRRVDNRMRVQR
jgi:hyperosmotically inducible protein